MSECVTDAVRQKTSTDTIALPVATEVVPSGWD